MHCSIRAQLALFSALLGLALALSLHRSANAPYQCEMTYMYPRYEPVPVPSATTSRYQLLLYRDDGVPSHAAGASHVRVAQTLQSPTKSQLCTYAFGNSTHLC